MLNFIRRYLWFVKLLQFGPFLSAGLVYIFFLPGALYTERDLYRELIAIGPPPQTFAGPINSGQNIVNAWASQSYGTRLKPEDALLYFDKKLSESGWVAQSHEIGSKRYCKGKYEATVSYSSGGQFSLHLGSDDYHDCRIPDVFHRPFLETAYLISVSFLWMFYGFLVSYAYWRMETDEYKQLFKRLRLGPLQALFLGLLGLAFLIFLASL